MSNAATLAGLAFSNASVGVCHSLAHAVGARFGIAHGRANGIFLPHVLRYNAALPRKFMPAPGYTTYVAPDKYAQMAWVHGLGGRTPDERRTRLFGRVEALLDEVGIPRSLAEAGVGRGGLRGGDLGARPGGVHGPEPAYQPAHAAGRRARRPAARGLDRALAPRCGELRPRLGGETRMTAGRLTAMVRRVFQVRIHGRGGQGVVTAAELLALAAFLEARPARPVPVRDRPRFLQGLRPVRRRVPERSDRDDTGGDLT